MGVDEIRKMLLLIKQSLCSRVSGVKCYLFGSIIYDSFSYNDVDILIIYENESELCLVKELLSELEALFPMHVIFLTSREELEFDFIVSQRAEYIFSI